MAAYPYSPHLLVGCSALHAILDGDPRRARTQLAEPPSDIGTLGAHEIAPGLLQPGPVGEMKQIRKGYFLSEVNMQSGEEKRDSHRQQGTAASRG